VRILVVEDEAAIAQAVRTGLEDERYVVDVRSSGDEGLRAAQSGEYDLVILDLLLPGIPGMEVCRRLRARGRAVPVLMLTARDATRDVVAGLDAGANDYLTKPFAFEELLARVRALLRTATRSLAAVVRVGPLTVDTGAHRASVGGAFLDLSAKEYQLAEYLAVHRGQIVSKERLAQALWSHDREPESNAIEVYIASLRRKLGSGRADLIHTVRGAGYVMRERGE
jgi:two-component system response regulator MprA